MKGVTEHQVRNRFIIESLAMGRPVIFGNRHGWLIRFEGADNAVLVHSRNHKPKVFSEVGSAAKRLFLILGCQIPVTVWVSPELDIDISPLPLLSLI